MSACAADDAGAGRELGRLFALAGHDPGALGAARKDVISILALLAVRALARPDLPAGWGGRLRTALALERSRAKAFDNIAQGVLADARVQALDPIVTRGAAIAATSYPAGFDRHTSQLSVLLRDGAAYAGAREALHGVDCRLEQDAPSGSRQLFRHRSGMPIFVYGGRNCNRLRDFRYDVLKTDARPGLIGGQPVLIPSPQHLWTELVYNAVAYDGEITVQWIIDAAWLLREPGLHPGDANQLFRDSRTALPYDACATDLARWLSSDPETPSAG